jgi:DNA anti-recombination protein RmuC
MTLENAEQFSEAIGTLAQGEVELEARVKALTGLVQAMDQRLKALTALLDHHHTILTKIAGLPPRPKGDPLVN